MMLRIPGDRYAVQVAYLSAPQSTLHIQTIFCQACPFVCLILARRLSTRLTWQFGQAMAEGVDNQFKPALDTKLAENSDEMASDGILGDMEALAHLLIRYSLGKERDDFSFPYRKLSNVGSFTAGLGNRCCLPKDSRG